ncbi:LPXTG cell wall anchor domain-containing protein [Streptococcus saliviloxodontae]|uniref:LPXTG-motif cell wall-anchored protein n=1 Tax=Streptococcus saliviloxodontae TaxID=1349416 RepID=A0ABS2PL63_9STRE|nr:LPXTG cell wall anchor domain-containing protein [Streptococcus saliviloxodontae]MBM7636170.1 LPXTG-motif cell wall-anchored protein [Streptococcus saliviloxodontae]
MVVHYVDESGNVIKNPVVDTSTGQPTATKPTTVAPAAKASAKASLPATGEKESGLAYIGAALLAATGLIFKRRKEDKDN